MTDIEISKALALAIGHSKNHVKVLGETPQVWVQTVPRLAWTIQVFDYRDWNVAAPIAAKLIVELIKCVSNGVVYWEATHGMEDDDDHAVATADTPQKAIALAVIQGAKNATNRT